MLRQLLVGMTVSACCIALHAVVMTAVVQAALRASRSYVHRPLVQLPCTMIATVLVLMAAHTSEILVWSLAYGLVKAAPEGADLIYFAFVNYTTLGYGDVVPTPDWRLLGPIAAMNGILLFGWSTAVIFEVLQKAVGKS